MFPTDDKIKRLKTLSRAEMRLTFYLCQGIKDDDKLDILLGNSEKTRGTQKTEIYRKLGLDKVPNDDKFKVLFYEYKEPLSTLIPNEEALKTYVPTPEIPPQKTSPTVVPEEKPQTPIDKLKSTQGATPPTEEKPLDKTPPTEPKIKPPRSRNPLLIPFLLVLCLLLGIIGAGGGYLYYFGFPNLIPSGTPQPIVVTATAPLPASTIESSPIPASTNTPGPAATLLSSIFTPTPTIEPTITPTKEIYPQGEWKDIGNSITARMAPNFYGCNARQNEFSVDIQFHHDGNNQYALRYDPSAFHATDDRGTAYTLIAMGMVNCYEVGIQNHILDDNDVSIYVKFGGTFPLEAQYLIITADSINGVKLVFRKDIQ